MQCNDTYILRIKLFSILMSNSSWAHTYILRENMTKVINVFEFPGGQLPSLRNWAVPNVVVYHLTSEFSLPPLSATFMSFT